MLLELHERGIHVVWSAANERKLPSIGWYRCDVERRARGATVSLRAGALIVLLTLAAAGCSGSASPAPFSTASASGTAGAPKDWPMYHGDPSHGCRSQSMPNVSGSPQVTESIKLDGAVY